MGKIFGSILMILGTSIGAGMLALPIVSAHATIAMTLSMLFAAWLLMTLGALALLEVTLWYGEHTNIMSMARTTIGRTGVPIVCALYLLLLYSLICAYLSGCSDVLQSLANATLGFHLPRTGSTLIALTLLGLIVQRGVQAVDMTNRYLMSIKFIAYAALIATIMPHISLPHLQQGYPVWKSGTFMVMLTAFGYSIIVPTLRSYLHGQRKNLIKVVLVGSLLPLFIYCVWVLAIQGSIPKNGTGGLFEMLTSSHTNSLLINAVIHIVHQPWIAFMTKLFISICALTSFLGSSVCLTDFIKDGLPEKYKHNQLLIIGLTYIPPLCVVLLTPGIFIKAMSYAGIWCVLLLVLLPMTLLYLGRYHHRHDKVHILPGCKWTIYLTTLACVIVLARTLF